MKIHNSNEVCRGVIPKPVIQSKKIYSKLTSLSSRSNSTSITLLTELSVQHAYIVVLEVDCEQRQDQSGQLVYFFAGADRRKFPSKVNGLLINAIDHGATQRKVENAMEVRRRTTPNYLMSDLFGFQLLNAERKGKNITYDLYLPLKNSKKSFNITSYGAMKAVRPHNPDIVVGGDSPLLTLRNADERELEFYKKKDLNVQWAIESYECKNELIPSALYYQPVQGYTIDHHNIFLDEIKGVLFDGIAMPIRNMSISDLAVFLVNLYQRGITRVHLLGTSAFPVIVLCAYAARNMFDWVSLDSSSSQQTAGYHGFYYPSDLTIEAVGRRMKISAAEKNPCQCQYCGGRSFHAIHKIEPNKRKVQLLLQHNYLAIENLVTDLLAKAGNIADLEKELRGRCRTIYRRRQVDKLMPVLSIVDSYKNGDIKMLQDKLAQGNKKRR